MNIHKQDQTDAACRDALGTLRTVAEQNGVPVQEPGHIVRGLVDTFMASIRPPSTFRVCTHAAGSPRPVFGRAHRPGELLCPACLKQACLHDYDLVQDYTCDSCGKFTPGFINACSAVRGMVTLLLGLCSECRNRDEASR